MGTCKIATWMLTAVWLAGAGIGSAEVLTTGGPVPWPADPPASVVRGALESDTDVVLFREQRNLQLPSAVAVDVRAPGSVFSPADWTPGNVAVGSFVDSYFLHVDPVGSSSDTVHFAASVTFDREVLGVMVDSGTKQASTPLLGAPGTSYDPDLGGPEQTDWLVLSDDRRTLSLRWLASVGLDQLRVITEGTPEVPYVTQFVNPSAAPYIGADGYPRFQHPFTDADPGVLLFVTQTYDGVIYTTPLGVWYDTVEERWALFRHYPTPFHPGSNQNVLVFEAGADVFLHVSTAGNTQFNWTYLDHPEANGNPDAKLLVQYEGGAGPAPVLHDQHLGVWYDAFAGQWAIFNEDNSVPMPAGLRFNVAVLPDDGTSFVHTSDAGNIFGRYTEIDHPALNGRPGAFAYLTHNWNPGGAPSGVYHEASALLYVDGRWRIWTDDFSVDPGISWNVYVPPTPSLSHVHVSDAGNSVGNFTLVDHAELNQSDTPILLETPRVGQLPLDVGAAQVSVLSPPSIEGEYAAGSASFGPGLDPTGITGTLVQATDGVGTTTDACEPVTNGPALAGNIAVIDRGACLFTIKVGHVQAAGAIAALIVANIEVPLNMGGEDPSIVIPSVALAQSDGALIQAQLGAGVVATLSSELNPHPSGIWYRSLSQQWSLFNQDLAWYPAGFSSNLYQPPLERGTFVHVADVHNTSDNATRLGHPLTEGDPDALVFATQHWNPAGAPGQYNDAAIGVSYDESDWSIVNNHVDFPEFALPIEEGVAFNVHVAGPGSDAFVHVTSAANIQGALTTIDHPALNGRPGARPIVTQVLSPGVLAQPIAVTYDSSQGRWQIRSQRGNPPMPEGAAFNVIPLPEPGVGAMLAAGVSLLGVLGHRRARR